MNATRLLYDAAGCPSVASIELANGPCWLCGQPLDSQGVPLKVVIKDTFVDYDKARAPHGSHFCPACAWSFSEAVSMEGRDKPQRLRNYSHIVQGGVWHCLSKGQKSEMKALLTHPPDGAWLGVIAESGQKHIIFRAPVAYGREQCAIQFEEQRLSYRPIDLIMLLSPVERLLIAGHSKTEIETGDYIFHRLMKTGMAAWQSCESRIQPHRGSLLMALVIFLAQKEETDERHTASSNRHGADTASVDGLGHMGQETPEILGHLPRGSSGLRLHQQPGGVAQLSLFADEHRDAGSE